MDGTCVEALFRELNSSKNLSDCARLRRDIRLIKNDLIVKKDYVGIIHILRFLKHWEKDRLFIDLINKWSESSLFVEAFADTDMYSYRCAYEMLMREYGNDKDSIEEAADLVFRDNLRAYLSKYTSEEDLEYVEKLSNGISSLARWMILIGAEITFQPFFSWKTPI